MTKKIKTLLVILSFAMTATALQAGTTIIVGMGPTPIDSGNNLKNALVIAAGGPAPVLIKLSPGVYDLNGMGINMLNDVDIEGSGRNITTILSNIPNGVAPGATVNVPPGINTELRDLTVRNESPTDGTALLNASQSLRVTECNFEADNGGNAVGIRTDGSSPRLFETRITVDGDSSVGIQIFSGDPVIIESLVIASGTRTVGVQVNSGSAPFVDQLAVLGLGGSNIGFQAFDSRPSLFRSRFLINGGGATGVALIRSPGEIKGSVADVNGSTSATGLTVTDGAPQIEESSFRASGNFANSVGVRLFGTASPDFDRSTAQGATNSVLTGVATSSARFGASKLVGPATAVALVQLTCISSYNGSYLGVNANCQ